MPLVLYGKNMGGSNTPTSSRRSVLTAIGTGVFAGSAIGTVNARSQNERPVTASANGVTIQIEDCQTAYVRGRSDVIGRIVAQLRYVRSGETHIIGSAVFVEPEVPMTIMFESLQDELFGTPDPIIIQSITVTTLDREQLVTLDTPDEWDCWAIIEDALDDTSDV